MRPQTCRDTCCFYWTLALWVVFQRDQNPQTKSDTTLPFPPPLGGKGTWLCWTSWGSFCLSLCAVSLEGLASGQWLTNSGQGTVPQVLFSESTPCSDDPGWNSTVSSTVTEKFEACGCRNWLEYSALGKSTALQVWELKWQCSCSGYRNLRFVLICFCESLYERQRRERLEERGVKEGTSSAGLFSQCL